MPVTSPTAGTRMPSARPRALLDPRLLLGLSLVLISVAGVVGIVSFADRTVAVYAAPQALSPGERVQAADLVQRNVSLDGADPLYLRVGSLPPEGLIVTRPVSRGELLPAAAVGDAAQADLTSVVVQVAGRVSAAVAPGASVDIWASPAADAAGTGVDPPTVVASRATVVQVLPDEGLVSRTQVAVEVLVPRARIAQLLQASSSGAALALVPTGLALGGAS